MIWLYVGWDVMGCLAGETGFNTKKFMKAFLIANVLGWSSYTFPLIGALTVKYKHNQWHNGWLVTK